MSKNVGKCWLYELYKTNFFVGERNIQLQTVGKTLQGVENERFVSMSTFDHVGFHVYSHRGRRFNWIVSIAVYKFLKKTVYAIFRLIIISGGSATLFV